MAALLCLSCLKKEEEEVTELDYRHCSLDDVPNEIFAYERTLEVLRLDCNNIRDLPRPLFHCHGLKELNLADNELGNIPPAVSSLALLTSLDVSKNVLTDLPETIKQCKHLAVVQASVNPLQKIPEGCTQLISLTELFLNDCLLEYIPANFGRLSKLKILELRDNSLNSLPKSMERLVNLMRIDLSQNQFTEVPEILNTMFELEELLLDGNKLKILPSFLGNFIKLKHLDASFNQLELVCQEVGKCSNLVDLTLSSNDLKQVPESLEFLKSLVTLKLDDNQLEKLPDNLGRMTSLEELYVSENFLTYLPPSIGWLRRIHTLNVDENDLEELPPEIGSCRHLKILSVHGNKLSGLPDEVGHLSQLAVLNLAGNYIPHLPVSFIKMKSITAIWLANNQNKPLVQLNTDIDPHTGMKVLTNFLLPQQPDPDRCGDNNSDSGSFHASVWEEERSKRSLVKWAGEDALDLDKTGNLRRAPTPFPKEMRAMAKKVQNMKEKRAIEEERNSKRRYNREYRSKTTKPSGRSVEETVQSEHYQQPQPSIGARSPKLPDSNKLKVYDNQTGADKISRDSGVISPSDNGVDDTDSSEEAHEAHENVSNVANNTLKVHDNPTIAAKNIPNINTNYLTPVKAEIVTNELDNDDEVAKTRPTSGSVHQQPPPYHIAATRSKQASNFYNIHHSHQASNHANHQNSQEEHFYENQESMKRPQAPVQPLERKASFLSDGTFESISESETSTAPSSLQTIIRAPYVISNNNHYNHNISEADISHPSSPAIPSKTAESDSEILASANNLRKVSEQLLNTSRNRSSISRPGSVAMSTPQSSRLPISSSTASSSSSRPNSQQSNLLLTPSTSRSSQLPNNSHTGRELRPNSFAGPPNTVGLPVPTPPSSGANNDQLKYQSKLPKLNQTPTNIPESNGLLSTISQAAISDDESPPATHKPNPPKFNTAVLSKPSPPLNSVLPNYENVQNQLNKPSHNQDVGPHQMTQGQYRAAASQAKVSTIPDEGVLHNSTYIPMGLRKNVHQASSIPLATSSPSGIPRYTSSVK